MEEKRTYTGVDICKFLMAFFVVGIHTADASGVFRQVLDIAVPFFFIASGFFLEDNSQRDDNPGSSVLKWTKRILKLYLVWTVVYLPFTVLGFKQGGLSVADSILRFARNLVFVGENHLSWPLWFLLALVYDGIIICLFKKCRLGWMYYAFTAAALFILGRVVDLFHPSWYFDVFATTRNGLFMGFPFVVLGMGIKRIEKHVSAHSIIVAVLGAFLLLSAYFQQFAAYFPPIGLFLIAILFNPGISLKNSRLLRNLSLQIYLVHMYIYGVLSILFNLQFGLCAFVVVSILSLLTAFLMEWLLTKLTCQK